MASIDEKHFLTGIIGDELICIFSRLKVDVFTWYETEAVEMHPDLGRLPMEIFKAIPKSSSNIDTARKYFDIMLREVDWLVRSWNDQLWAIKQEPINLIAAKSMIDSPVVTGAIEFSPTRASSLAGSIPASFDRVPDPQRKQLSCHKSPFSSRNMQLYRPQLLLWL
jgi:hypothetical protein